MHDAPRNINTKFGSYWSSSFRGEEFWKIVDDDGRQVIAIAHMAYGQVIELKKGDTVQFIMQKQYTKYLSLSYNRSWETCYKKWKERTNGWTRLKFTPKQVKYP